MESLSRTLSEKQEQIRSGGETDKVGVQHKAGKLTAWERIELLTDPGSFMELDEIVQHRSSYFGLDRQFIPRDGVITGLATDPRPACRPLQPGLHRRRRLPRARCTRPRSPRSWTWP